MWTYYGSKATVINHYPPPLFDQIIEPFAGSARYSLKYFDRAVILVDAYDVIVNLWKWLQQCSENDIKSLPHFVKPGQLISDLKLDCPEAEDLLGFLVGFGMERPRKKASVFRMKQRPNHVNYSLNRIEKNLYKIRHWEIRLGDYREIPNRKATWFMDPPYQFGGHCYVHSNKKIDYPVLGNWCRSREGQVLVCENTLATWMDFKPMLSHKGSKGMQQEGIWSNEVTAFDNRQLRFWT